MTDRPIIFSAPMVRALLLEANEPGTGKSMTRRLRWSGGAPCWKCHGCGKVAADPEYQDCEECPECKGWGGKPTGWRRVKPGDRLWVRENLTRRKGNFLGIPQNVVEAHYAADDEDVVEERGFNVLPWWKGKGGLPSIHMPRWASRLTLVVTTTKIERLQAVSEQDCEREGLVWVPKQKIWGVKVEGGYSPYGLTAQECFMNLFCDLHGPSIWRDNPEVVAISFTVHRRNVDAKEKAA